MAKKKLDYRELGRVYSLLLTLGINMVVCIGICTYLGIYLDGKFTSKPAFTLAGVLIGVLAGLWSVFKMLRRYIERK